MLAFLVSHANPHRRHAAGLVASAVALVLAGASALGQGEKPAPAVEWKTYGADLASTRYSPLDQINRENFSKLQIAWRLKTDPFGPRPDTLYSSTPLVVGNVLYTTAGTRRAVVALNAATGEMLWMHTEDEGARGQNAARSGAGRGVSYWASADGSDQRILYVTPGYRMIALNARTGLPIPAFGKDGVVDLKLENDQELDPVTADLGLNATPLVAGDVVVVGAAQRFSGSPRTMNNVRGIRARVRREDRQASVDLPHGAEARRVRLRDLGRQLGASATATPARGRSSAPTSSSAWSTCPSRCRPAISTVATGRGTPSSTRASSRSTSRPGKRKWHYQITHHGVWDYDPPCAPILFDITLSGRRVKALAQPTKQAFLFVLNRETGEPIWPIEERPVPQSDGAREKTSPTQPFPTRPLPFDRQGIGVDDLIDFTPALRAEALEVIKRFRIGPMYTPPVLSDAGGPLATLQVPADHGGANWPGGSLDPETNRLYIHSHTAVFAVGIVPADADSSDMGFVSGCPCGRSAGTNSRRRRRRGGRACWPWQHRRRWPWRRPRWRSRNGGGGRGRAVTTVQGLPLIKPPYDRITAYDMNTGDLIWQKTHSSTPDEIKNHPALKGLDLPRLGQYGRTFIGVLATKSLLIAGEGGVHTNEAGQRVSLLRAYDKATGADVGAVDMPEKQTGSPMTYMVNGRQYIVLAVSGANGAELIAYALPR